MTAVDCLQNLLGLTSDSVCPHSWFFSDLEPFFFFFSFFFFFPVTNGRERLNHEQEGSAPPGAGSALVLHLESLHQTKLFETKSKIRQGSTMRIRAWNFHFTIPL